tara:strand:- start:208 stop:468 length:261 start_codon:yes stop_codon:yes gene_type:complete
MSKQKDTPSTPTNAAKNCYMAITDFSGPPNASGRIHVQIAVFRDKEMTDLIDLRQCYSVVTMNDTLEVFTERYGLVKMATIEGDVE